MDTGQTATHPRQVRKKHLAEFKAKVALTAAREEGAASVFIPAGSPRGRRCSRGMRPRRTASASTADETQFHQLNIKATARHQSVALEVSCRSLPILGWITIAGGQKWFPLTVLWTGELSSEISPYNASPVSSSVVPESTICRLARRLAPQSRARHELCCGAPPPIPWDPRSAASKSS